MKNNLDYALGLLNLVYVLIRSDKEFSDAERLYLEKIRDTEGCTAHVFDMLMSQVAKSSERDCYHAGIHHISMCSREEQVRAFAWMLKMVYADGKVSPREVRLLLYAVKRSEVSIEEVMERAGVMEVAW